MTNILILLATVWLLFASTVADNETISSQQPVVNHLRKVENNEDDENAILPSSSSVSTTSFNEQQSQSIFINQSNNMYILAKYGQTINLPCIIYRLRNPDLVNVHAIWHKLVEKHRPIVLSIGMQQLKQDMRYRVKVINMNKTKSQHGSQHHHHAMLPSIDDNANSDDSIEAANHQHHHHHSSSRKYLIQNWSFEIRKLTYEDSGTYQCLLPLVKPITKNITLQVIPDLVVEPRDATFKIDDKIRLTCRTTLRSNAHHQKKHHHAQARQQRPGILWYKDNEPIRSSSSSYRGSSSPDGVVDPLSTSDRQIEIETKQEENGDEEALLLNSVLTIHNARIDDAGKYKCIYENIQEQVNVKVIYDYFEYKNFLTSSASKTARLTLTQMAIFFVLCLYLLSSVI